MGLPQTDGATSPIGESHGEDRMSTDRSPSNGSNGKASVVDSQASETWNKSNGVMRSHVARAELQRTETPQDQEVRDRALEHVRKIRKERRNDSPMWVPERFAWIWDEPDRSTWGPCRNGVANIVEATLPDDQTNMFDLVVGCVIVFNIAVLWREIDANAAGRETPEWIVLTNHLLLGFYTVELGIRMTAYGRHYFLCPNNWLDVFIVLAGLVSLLPRATASSNRFQMFRLVRVCRLIRMMKLISRFPTLKVLIRGFTGAMQAMGWGLLVILFLIIMWAILSVEFVNNTAQTVFTSDSAQDMFCRDQFSTVMKAMMLLFQTLIAGDSWGKCAMPIIAEDWKTFGLFAAALVSLQLGFTNLVLAIIVDQASEARAADKEAELDRKKEETKESVDLWAELVACLDVDMSGTLTLEELLLGTVDEETSSIFTRMGMDREELIDAFCLLDTNGDGSIDHADFTRAFHQAHNQDQRVYLMGMKLQLSKIQWDMEVQFEELRAALSLNGDTAQRQSHAGLRRVHTNSRNSLRGLRVRVSNADTRKSMAPGGARASMRPHGSSGRSGLRSHGLRSQGLTGSRGVSRPSHSALRGSRPAQAMELDADSEPPAAAIRSSKPRLLEPEVFHCAAPPESKAPRDQTPRPELAALHRDLEARLCALAAEAEEMASRLGAAHVAEAAAAELNVASATTARSLAGASLGEDLSGDVVAQAAKASSWIRGGQAAAAAPPEEAFQASSRMRGRHAVSATPPEETFESGCDGDSLAAWYRAHVPAAVTPQRCVPACTAGV